LRRSYRERFAAAFDVALIANDDKRKSKASVRKRPGKALFLFRIKSHYRSWLAPE